VGEIRVLGGDARLQPTEGSQVRRVLVEYDDVPIAHRSELGNQVLTYEPGAPGKDHALGHVREDSSRVLLAWRPGRYARRRARGRT
jgi:hypothetical protein